MTNQEQPLAQRLIRALKLEDFRFIVLQISDERITNDLVRFVHEAYPSRKVNRFQMRGKNYRALMDAIETQETGILFLDGFQEILKDAPEDEKLYLGFNQRRDKLAKLPIALVVVIPNEVQFVQDLKRKMPDLWSFRNLVLTFENRPYTSLDNQSPNIQESSFPSSRSSGSKEMVEYESLKNRLAHLEDSPSTHTLRSNLFEQVISKALDLNQFQEALSYALAFKEHGIRYHYKEEQPEKWADILHDLGRSYDGQAHYEKAELSYLEALGVYRKLSEVNPDAFLSDVAMTQNNLGALYRDLQQFEKAEASYLEALGIYRKLAEANPDAFLSDVAMTQNNLGTLYAPLQQFEKAESSYLEALGIRRKLAEANPDAFLSDVAMTQNNLGILYRNLQQFEKAEAFYLEALGIYRKLAEANPDAFLSDVAMTQNNLGALYRDLQQFGKAEASYLEALEIRRKLAEANPDAFNIDLGMTSVSLAIFYTNAQPYQEKAVQCAHEALKAVLPYAEIVPRAKQLSEIALAVLADWEEEDGT